MPSVVFAFGDSSKEVDLKDINSVDDVASNMKEVIKTEKKLTDEQIEYVTDVMHGTIMDISNEIGFKPERDDIIKCLEYALKSL